MKPLGSLDELLVNESQTRAHTHSARSVYLLVFPLELKVMPACVYLLVTDPMRDSSHGMFCVCVCVCVVGM